ncbi:MAG: polysaccharide deacetylase family protein [Bacteriovoracaceae bacterium]|nr:polysaccharide deacetylase family protein [Bacteriovoracaceae bacterium]
MKSLVVLASLLIGLSAQAELKIKQFPDDGRDYRPGVDSGFETYRTKSMLNTKKVVLTFDDGPHIINTPKTLDVLKKYGAKATFFVLTENISEKTMPIIKRIVQEGHILASHHHDHQNNNGKSEAQYKQELEKTVTLIAELNAKFGGSNELYYRFPYGEYGSGKLDYHHFNVMKEVSNNVFQENCINFAFWDIDSLDWLSPMSEKDIVSAFRWWKSL